MFDWICLHKENCLIDNEQFQRGLSCSVDSHEWSFIFNLISYLFQMYGIKKVDSMIEFNHLIWLSCGIFSGRSRCTNRSILFLWIGWKRYWKFRYFLSIVWCWCYEWQERIEKYFSHSCFRENVQIQFHSWYIIVQGMYEDWRQSCCIHIWKYP